jgi:8-oxo-dGTP pyrophosphatase MutT (NUDIX family)
MDDMPALRQTARALLFDPQDRLLLICYEAARDLPGRAPGDRAFWYTPGGGLEPGESFAEAVIRELSEEVGVTHVPVGPMVAIWQAPIRLFIRPTLQDARFFVMRAPSDVIDTRDLQATEMDPVLDVRWFRLDELLVIKDRIEPAGLVDLVQLVLSGGVLDEPVRLGNRLA